MLLGNLEFNRRSMSLTGDKKIVKRGRKEICDEEDWALQVFWQYVNVEAVLFIAPFLRRD